MPVYEYRCDAYGHTFEVVQKMDDAPLSSCERCGGAVARVLYPVAVHFKGTGFYATDYDRAKRRPGASDGDGPKGKVKGDADAKGSGDASSGDGEGAAKKAAT